MATSDSQNYIVAPNLRGTKSRWVGTMDVNKDTGMTVKTGRRILLKRGDRTPFELTAAEAKSLGADVVKAPAAKASKATADDDTTTTDYDDLLSKNAPDVIAHINKLDDPDEVEAIAEAEAKGKDRKMVLEAAQARYDELTAE